MPLFLQMNAEQLHALEQDERLSYVGKSIYMGSLEPLPISYPWFDGIFG